MLKNQCPFCNWFASGNGSDDRLKVHLENHLLVESLIDDHGLEMLDEFSWFDDEDTK